jgi:hypothetical protein
MPLDARRWKGGTNDGLGFTSMPCQLKTGRVSRCSSLFSLVLDEQSSRLDSEASAVSSHVESMAGAIVVICYRYRQPRNWVR